MLRLSARARNTESDAAMCFLHFVSDCLTNVSSCFADEAGIEDMEVDSGNKSGPEPEIEPYEDWKARILELSHKELKLQEGTNTPCRRSPRKTPQKFSPYRESGSKPLRGVRLLFPMSS